ncbi:MAG: PQQ-binding-like beta-propeller repeat protein [Phycisphaerae bacterium]
MSLLRDRIIVSSTLLAASLGATPALAQWPQWGGPDRNFVVNTKGLAEKWPDTGPQKVWTSKIGDGFSAVLVDDGKLYTMTRSERNEVAVCVSAEKGDVLWKHEYEAPFSDDMGMEFGPGPHATPLIAGDRMFTIGVTAKMFALDKKTGKVAWEHDLKSKFNAHQLGRGFSSSPIAYKNSIIVQVGGGPGQSLMAFDQTTGSVVWGEGDFENSHASPILIKVGGQDQLVVFSAQKVLGCDPATGKQLWEYTHETQFGANISTPVWGDDGILFITSAYGGGGRGLKLENKDGKTSVTELWFNRKIQCQHGTALRVGGHVYVSSGDFGPAFLMCVDVKTGEIAWRERVPKATVVAGDGKIIWLDQEGALGMVAADPKEFRQLGKTELMQRVAWTVPTLVGTKLYVRDRANLVALELGK